MSISECPKHSTSALGVLHSRFNVGDKALNIGKADASWIQCGSNSKRRMSKSNFLFPMSNSECPNQNLIPSRQLQLTLPLCQDQIALQFMTTFYKPKPRFLHSSIFPPSLRVLGASAGKHSSFLILHYPFIPSNPLLSSIHLFFRCQLGDALL